MARLIGTKIGILERDFMRSIGERPGLFAMRASPSGLGTLVHAR